MEQIKSAGDIIAKWALGALVVFFIGFVAVGLFDGFYHVMFEHFTLKKFLIIVALGVGFYSLLKEEIRINGRVLW